MSRVLILGAGQVGAFAARAIAERGVEILAADLEPAMEYFARFGPQADYDLVSLNVLDRSAVSDLLKSANVDVVVACFGLNGTASQQNPTLAWTTNVVAMEGIAAAMLEAGISRLVFVSSFAVYGRPAVDRIAEAVTPQPKSIYGQMKLAAETALVHFRTKGLDVRILRPCGVYGPLRHGQGSHSAVLIESLLVGGLRGMKLTLSESSVSADEYLYIKDLGRAVSLVALTDTLARQFVFNVGTGRKVTGEDLHTAVRHVVPGISLHVESREPEHERALPPLDVSCIQKVFAFVPSYTLEQGLADYCAEAGFAP